MKNERVQQFIIRRSNPDYYIYNKMGHVANNIYNLATYYARQWIIHKNGYPSNSKLDKTFKHIYKTRQNMLYHQCGVHFCQQILREVNRNFSDYWKAIQAFKKDPGSYNYKRPRLPHYHKKGSTCSFILDNQTIRFNSNSQMVYITSKRSHNWWRHALKHDIKLDPHEPVKKIQQVQVIPGKYYTKILVAYIPKLPSIKPDNHRYLTIDPGLDNLACVGSNVPGLRSFIINGRPVKSINQFANKRIARTKGYLKKINHVDTSHYLDFLFNKRHYRIDKYMHEACKYIVDYALNHECNRIVIGNGASRSQRGADLGKRTNQNFIQVPFGRLIQMLSYKARNAGLQVISTEESYTSQSSFLDSEKPCQTNGNIARAERNKAHHGKLYKHSTRRIKRGLFVADTGKIINADLNGALQILKKVIPKAFSKLNVDEIKGLALAPVKITLAYC